jgi:hypothetical protein
MQHSSIFSGSYGSKIEDPSNSEAKKKVSHHEAKTPSGKKEIKKPEAPSIRKNPGYPSHVVTLDNINRVSQKPEDWGSQEKYSTFPGKVNNGGIVNNINLSVTGLGSKAEMPRNITGGISPVNNSIPRISLFRFNDLIISRTSERQLLIMGEPAQLNKLLDDIQLIILSREKQPIDLSNSWVFLNEDSREREKIGISAVSDKKEEKVSRDDNLSSSHLMNLSADILNLIQNGS